MITFNDAFLQSLSEGTHQIEIMFLDGGIALTSLTVSATSDDDGMIPILVIMGAIALAGVAAAIFIMRR